MTDIDIRLTEVGGRLDVIDTKIATVSRDLSYTDTKATRAHERLDHEMDALRRELTGPGGPIVQLQQLVQELREWRKGAVGLMVGIALGSGVFSGGVVAAAFQLLGK